jgi:tRNA-modifying protein YgfZ
MLKSGNSIDLQTAIQTARLGAAIYDSSDWGKILVSDQDRLRFLHNQSTADFEKLQPGSGCDTVFILLLPEQSISQLD